MKEVINQWLQRNAPLPGLLACGVRYPDETFSIPPNRNFPRENLENALRCVADTFQVVKMNQFPNEYLRWIYQNALLYCMKRRDGALLAVFTSREPDSVDIDALGKMLGEFSTMGPLPVPPAQ